MYTLLEKFDTKPALIENNSFLPDNCPWIKIEEESKKEGSDKVIRKYSVIPMELSNWFRNNMKYIFVRTQDSSSSLIYIFSDGYYKMVSNEQFKGFIKNFIPYQLRTTRAVNEIFFDLTTDVNCVNSELLNSNENIINFQDGLLNIYTGELMPHTPDILSTIQIPANYVDVANSNDYSPVFDDYMNTLCDGDKESIDLLLQCIRAYYI